MLGLNVENQRCKYFAFRKQIKELLKSGKNRTEIAMMIGISKVSVCRAMRG